MLDQTPNTPLQSPSSSAPPVKLWTPGFVAGVTFLLGFPAGIVIASLNWMRMEMRNKGLMHLLGGVVVTFVFVIALLLLPGTASRGIGLLANLGILFYLQQQMKKDIETFRAANNAVENAGQLGGCLIGLGVLVLFLITAFAISFAFVILGVPIPN
jgi:hypothetical protein